MRGVIRALVLACLLAAASAAVLWTGQRAAQAQGKPRTAHCLAQGAWTDGEGRALTNAEAIAMASRADVVLLGEAHATPAHHLWQRDVIAAVAKTGRPVVIGLEQLPRAAQSALDAFVSGRIDEADFLQQSRWAEVWGHDFAAYRPVFEFARATGTPMIALNVDRDFVRSVARHGFAAAASGGAPIGPPEPPSPAYRERLAGAFAAHGGKTASEGFARFVEAQTVWDRAMAESLAAALVPRSGAIAVGLMGQGHVERGHGVEHQLAALGVAAVFSAIPVATEGDCLVEPGLADALFGAK